MRVYFFSFLLVVSWLRPVFVRAQDALSAGEKLSAPAIGANLPAAALPEVEVVSKALDVSRNQILPGLGATQYTVTGAQISAQSQGENAPINQTILRFPGVAQDSYSQLHVRGEHANLQYRIDGVMLPEGISVFGQELSTRFVDSVSLVTGALPAQYGQRTAGVIDIQTKNGGDAGRRNLALRRKLRYRSIPVLNMAARAGNSPTTFTGNFLHDDIGIENPTGSSHPIHDGTDQFKGFGYLSYVIDDTSRVSVILSGAHSDFEIPGQSLAAAKFYARGGAGV